MQSNRHYTYVLFYLACPQQLILDLNSFISAAATVDNFGLVSLNQTELQFVPGLNNSIVPVATIFTVNASDLATANQVSALLFISSFIRTHLSYDQIIINLLGAADPNSSLVIINVRGSVEGRVNITNALVQLNGLPATNLLWNVCEANLVGLRNVQLQGSLLAPSSAVELTYAHPLMFIIHHEP